MWELPCLKLRVRWALEVEEWVPEVEWAPEVEEWAPVAPVVEAAPTGWALMVQAVLVVAWEGAHMVGRAHVVVDSPVWEAFTETHIFQDMVDIILPFFPEGIIGIVMEPMGHFKSLRKINDCINSKIQTSS